RHGNKGIISKIFGNYDMPFLLNGQCLDILLNPLGVPSRMNVGQILECILGLTGQIFHTKFQTVCFDEMNGYEASRSFIYSKLLKSAHQTKQKWLFSKKTPGKVNIFDGRDGQIFHQSVLVGCAYIMKLIHIVDEKMNARSIGSYSLITQQPLRGRAKQGGQRVGEMEVWALQGFGCAYTLQELLTVKSDDLMGRNRLMLTLLKNTPLNKGTPESLRVVLRELQSLCLDFNLLY
ncbi:DNA-directed RNA polymerase subunit beta, partial [Escherichia coli]